MPKKYHKRHRHREKHHSNQHHKRRKDNALDPHGQTGKKNLKIDQNACGDYVNSSLSGSKRRDVKQSRQRQSSVSNKPTEVLETLPEKKEVSHGDRRHKSVIEIETRRNIFDKNYLKKVEKSIRQKSVRHQSLEKNESGLMEKSKLLFRKEKSFNDAIPRPGDYKMQAKIQYDSKKEIVRNHRAKNPNPSKEREHSKTRPIKETRDVSKESKKHTKKQKSKDRNQDLNLSRVQEVIFCHTSQVPYKLKNDRDASEIKDLYRRMKKEKKKDDQIFSRTPSPKSADMKYLSNAFYQTNHDKSRSHNVQDKNKEEIYHSNIFTENHSSLYQAHPVDSKMLVKKKHKHREPSDFDIGPYEKYFAFEKHYRKHRNHSAKKEKKIEEVMNKNKERSSSKTDVVGLKVPEQKIHQIVEGDMKNYFSRIQNMIDSKIEHILQASKDRRKAREEKESTKRQKSNNNKKTDKNIEEVSNLSDQNKSLDKEDIVNEVLKRLKAEEKREKHDKAHSHHHHHHHRTSIMSDEATVQHFHHKEPKLSRPREPQSSEQTDCPDCHRHKQRSSSRRLEKNDQPLDASRRRHRHSQMEPSDDKSLLIAIHDMSSSRTFPKENSKEPLLKQTRPHDPSFSCKKRKKEERFIDMSILEATPNFEEIILPPEGFRCPNGLESNRLRKQRFIVQGIEPPILERSKDRHRNEIRVRELECKTVSIIGITPVVEVREKPLENQTQTSNKSHKSSVTEKDLVEKRMKSKRFKLYYKYSTINGSNESSEMSSEAKSIVSDSYKVVSDPSEEDIPVKNNNMHFESKAIRKRNHTGDYPLNNIVEEPSDGSIPLQEYFVPIRGTKQYYNTSFSSSHSEYCFKIDKKRGNSNISLQSKEPQKHLRHRRHKSNVRSKSDFKLRDHATSGDYCVIKSQSDVLLMGNKGKQVIKTIFLEDTHPFTRSRKNNKSPQMVKKEERASKECQTLEVCSSEIIRKEKEAERKQQMRFREIYNTLGYLEKNICTLSQTSLDTPDPTVRPAQTGQIDVVPLLNNLKDELIQTKESVKKVDVAVGSTRPKIRKPIITIHDAAIGTSRAGLITEPKITPRSRSVQRPQVHKKMRSTGVSPLINPSAVTHQHLTLNQRLELCVFQPVGVRKPKTPKTSEIKSTIKPQNKRSLKVGPGRPTLLNLPPPERRSINRSAPVRPTVTPRESVRTDMPAPIKVFRSEEKPRNAQLPIDIQTEERLISTQDLNEDERYEERPPPRLPTPVMSRLNNSNSYQQIEVTEKSCIHGYIPPRIPPVPAPRKRPPRDHNELIVHTATYSCKLSVPDRPDHLISATSSSVSDSAIQTATRSKSLLDNVSRSKSEVLLTPTSNRPTTKGGSSFSGTMERFRNIPNSTCLDGRSNATYLDQYVNSKLSSGVFLTKDYKNSKLSAYQRRKLYDQAIRQKMRKKNRFAKMNVGPQVYEVRYLSMVDSKEQQLEPERSPEPVGNLKLQSILNNKIYGKRCGSEPTNVVDKFMVEKSLKATEKNLIFEQPLVKEVVVETDKSKATEMEGEMLVQFCQQFLGSNGIETQQRSVCNNFMGLLETLCSYIAKQQQSAITKETTDKKKVHFPDTMAIDQKLEVTVENEGAVKVEELFSSLHNETSSVSAPTTETSKPKLTNSLECFKRELLEVDQPITINEPMSCPILFSNSSSFDFLYEENASPSNMPSRNAIIANLTRPFDQTFNFNTRQYNVETPFVHAGNCKSKCGSIESGYSSTKSKSCGGNSVSNFFKKPNIVALMHPTTKSNTAYREMSGRCRLYAEKVKQNSVNKSNQNERPYEELSLKCLLSKTSSVLLKEKLPSEHDSFNSSFDNAQDYALETDEEPTIAPSLETVVSNSSVMSYSQKGCKLILSNEVLNIESFTYLGPEIFSEEDKTISVKGSVISTGTDYLNPFSSNRDSGTQKFLMSLIKVYEKEAMICESLYRDKKFEKQLMAKIEEREMERKKPKKLSRLCAFFNKKRQEKELGTKAADEQQQLEMENKFSSHLQALASNSKKCFTMLAEAVKINENIDKETKICGLLRLLERIEKGDFQIMENDDHSNFEDEIRTQILNAFLTIYDLCLAEAKKYKRRVGNDEIALIKSFVIKHRIGLLSKTDIVASYIGRGIIRTEEQLKDAVTYLVRTQFQEVNLKMFEEYCKFTL